MAHCYCLYHPHISCIICRPIFTKCHDMILSHDMPYNVMTLYSHMIYMYVKHLCHILVFMAIADTDDRII